MTETPLDRAHAAMMAAPDDDAARLRFFERLGDAELFLLLEGEAEGEQITPQVFDPGSGPLVLVFDREERLTAFVGAAAPYAAISGRVVAGLLAAEGLGLGLNLDVAPSSFLLDGDGVAWLAQTLGNAPDRVEARLAELHPPAGLPDVLVQALDTKLATATGLAQMAYLVGTQTQDGARGHMLAFVGAIPGADTGLSQAVAEALTFSGIEAGA
ncbi:MAG: SseB family protein, partial [Pseudomonadota bacterium]